MSVLEFHPRDDSTFSIKAAASIVLASRSILLIISLSNQGLDIKTKKGKNELFWRIGKNSKTLSKEISGIKEGRGLMMFKRKA